MLFYISFGNKSKITITIKSFKIKQTIKLQIKEGTNHINDDTKIIVILFLTL